ALFRGASDAADWAVPPERRAEELIKHALTPEEPALAPEAVVRALGGRPPWDMSDPGTNERASLNRLEHGERVQVTVVLMNYSSHQKKARIHPGGPLARTTSRCFHPPAAAF
ncbi:MAG: hypothetical protein JXA30_11200, partial [Deltaproteobacteria bacterium]|nr:hypothetical protein [Deltaproteobacteria bacterium]